MATKQDGEFSAFVPLDENADTYRLACSTTTANIAVAAGNYKVFLKGSDPSTLVFLKLGTSSGVTASEVTAGSHTAGTMCMRGDEIERVIISSTYTHIAAILSTGATSADLIIEKLA